MTTATAPIPPCLPPAPMPIASEPGVVIAQTEAFLDQCQDNSVHPDDVARQLVRGGWEPSTAQLVADRYRGRFDEHRLGYSGFLVSVGFAALSLGSAGHLLLAMAEGRDPSRAALAFWLSLLVIALPLAVWSWVWIRRVDDTDPVAAWSRPRQQLARTLLWCCGIVGGARLLHYVTTAIATLTGAAWAADRNLLVGLGHVALTTGITLPLGRWAFGFLHRFDGR